MILNYLKKAEKRPYQEFRTQSLRLGELCLKKKRLMIWVAVLAALALAALFTGGCSGRGETGSGAGDGLEPYRVGAVVDISGPSSSLGGAGAQYTPDAGG
jgi:hypothetical protein